MYDPCASCLQQPGARRERERRELAPQLVRHARSPLADALPDHRRALAGAAPRCAARGRRRGAGRARGRRRRGPGPPRSRAPPAASAGGRSKDRDVGGGADGAQPSGRALPGEGERGAARRELRLLRRPRPGERLGAHAAEGVADVGARRAEAFRRARARRAGSARTRASLSRPSPPRRRARLERGGRLGRGGDVGGGRVPRAAAAAERRRRAAGGGAAATSLSMARAVADAAEDRRRARCAVRRARSAPPSAAAFVLGDRRLHRLLGRLQLRDRVGVAQALLQRAAVRGAAGVLLVGDVGAEDRRGAHGGRRSSRTASRHARSVGSPTSRAARASTRGGRPPARAAGCVEPPPARRTSSLAERASRLSADHGSSGAVGGGVGGMSAARLAASPESICASIISSADIDSQPGSARGAAGRRARARRRRPRALCEGRMFFQTIE